MNDEAEMKKLLQEIEALKERLNHLISKKELLHPEVIEISQQLDELLTRYYEIIKDKKAKSSPKEDALKKIKD